MIIDKISVFAIPGLAISQVEKNISDRNGNKSFSKIVEESVRLLESRKHTKAKEHIFNHVCGIYGVEPKIVLKQNKSRKREYALVRQITMSLFKLGLKTSNATAGLFFKKDHSTCVHAIKTVRNLIETNGDFRKEVGYLFHGIQFPIESKFKHEHQLPN
jgi:chromosomal replication initiation ATPase DnaA